LRRFGACIRHHILKKLCKKIKGKKADEPEDDEESIMADAVENDEDETEVESDEEEDPSRRRPTGRPNRVSINSYI
jgi:hypothetical protein